MFPSLCQLPQCLCIHLQRLTWSSEGTPIKRQEHVQFTEYLSMDRYKHNSSAQRSQRVKCAPSPIRPENSDDSTAKPIANGTGTLDFSSLWFNPVSHSDLFFFVVIHLYFVSRCRTSQQQQQTFLQRDMFVCIPSLSWCWPTARPHVRLQVK